MLESEAEVQATADLSPVSPSPVHIVLPAVVPALQDTVDTIEAMVAAANGSNESIMDPDLHLQDEADDDVDDDSFNDAYADDDEAASITTPTADFVADPEEDNDDYAKTFDSPLDPNEAEAIDIDIDVDVDVDANIADPLIAVNDVKSTSTMVSEAATPTPTSLLATGHLADNTGTTSAAVSLPYEAQIEPQQSTSQTHLDDHHQQQQQASAIDIGQLVADLIAQPQESSTTTTTTHDAPAANEASNSPSAQQAVALPSASSLPPRPPIPQPAPQSYTSASSSSSSQHHPIAAPGSGQSPMYAPAPGTLTDTNISNLPPPPTGNISAPGSTASLTPTQHQSHGFPSNASPDTDYQHQWDQFVADERQYMSEAKWDRFPEGSRIFIGNLSSDKVSKRDVFELFRHFGRLAQISLKSAYGFVQYHTVDEGTRAVDNLQDHEVKGRRIHLEISRVQDKSKKDRNSNRSPPDRNRGNRDSVGSRRGDKHQPRDDHRSGRGQSPRRNDYHGRDDGYSRDRNFQDTRRGRSRSPGYGRQDKDQYRRRSASPYGRSRNDDDLDLPRRYGADVPDIQLILQQEVDRNFVAWIEGAFREKGLKSEVMFLHPRFPKDKVIQRQAAEGVYAVIELDMHAQRAAKIPVQVFNRSGGTSNIRFDKYVDLEPGTAAEIVLRAKAASIAATYTQQSQPQPQPPQQTYPPAGGYTQAAYGVPQHQAPPAYPPQPAAYPQQQQQQPVANVADIANLMSKVDSATLHQLLASMQGAPQAAAMAPVVAHSAPQVDLQAILGALNTNGANPAAAAHASQQPQYPTAYGAQPPMANGNGAQPQAGNDPASAAQVQNIMAQLARFR